MPVFRNRSAPQNLIETHCHLCRQSLFFPYFLDRWSSPFQPDVISLPPIKNFLVIPLERAETRMVIRGRNSRPRMEAYDEALDPDITAVLGMFRAVSRG